jgi:hypothetical protein
MDEAVERIHEATEELRRSLVGLDGRAQLRLLNGSTAAVSRLRVEIEGMRTDALDLLVNDLQDESIGRSGATNRSNSIQPEQVISRDIRPEISAVPGRRARR